MDQKPFSVRRAFQNDFAMTSGILIPAVVWVVFLLTMFFRPGGSPLVLGVAVAATLLSPLLFWYRLRALRRLIEAGPRVQGTVRKVMFDGDRGRMMYSYLVDGKSITSSTVIYRTKETQGYREGQIVDLVLDPSNPERAVLRDLYT